MPRTPDRTVTFTFNFDDPDLEKLEEKVKDVRDNLSAVVLHQNNLWLGGDEGTSIHRLTRDKDNFNKHVSFDLRKLLPLPIDDPNEEIDFEGLDINEGKLWFTGSHSAKRERPKEGKTFEKNLERITTPKIKGNRFMLGRMTLRANGTDFEPDSAACLQANAEENELTRALAADPLFSAFVPRPSGKAIPSKDNGLDLEGLAVSGERVFVGLRGPVLRGWTTILELHVSEAGPKLLKLKKVGSSGALFRRQFLDLRGLGVRDLAIDNNDLLILAGPTMVLDGPVFVYRWKDALDQTDESFISEQKLIREFSLPCGNEADKTETKDHAEGICLVKGTPQTMLVCYDSPSEGRISGSKRLTVTADMFRL
jgi:hypothetical protein